MIRPISSAYTTVTTLCKLQTPQNAVQKLGILATECDLRGGTNQQSKRSHTNKISQGT